MSDSLMPQGLLRLVYDEVLKRSILSLRDAVELMKRYGAVEESNEQYKEMREMLAEMEMEAKRRGLVLPEEEKARAEGVELSDKPRRH